MIGSEFSDKHNQVKESVKFIEQNGVEEVDKIDFAAVFDILGAQNGPGDQSSREEDWEEYISYARTNGEGERKQEVWNTNSAGEWYRQTSGNGRWAVEMNSADCNPFDDGSDRSAYTGQGNNAQGNSKRDLVSKKDKSWRWYDERPMPSITESIDAGVNAIVAWRAYPRFVIEDYFLPEGSDPAFTTTCRTAEWLAGQWYLHDQDTYDNRSRKTRNVNKCGNGSKVWKQEGYVHGNGKGPACDIREYNQLTPGQLSYKTRWEDLCVENGNGLVTISLDTYEPCVSQVVNQEEYNSVTIVPNFEDDFEVFVEECYPDGRCYYEELVSGDEYTYLTGTAEYSLVAENLVSEPNSFTIAYTYVLKEESGASALFYGSMAMLLAVSTTFI